MMTEDEVEIWYDEEKQTLMDEYITKLENKQDSEAAKNEYEKKLQHVIQKYNSMQNKIIERQVADKIKEKAVVDENKMDIKKILSSVKEKFKRK
ncbi:MAG: hypothetical protein GY861_06980 [bacterium]|nr:hypothetical protein [bacterium]